MRNFLEPPFLPRSSAPAAAEAARVPWPVWLAGGPGAGAYHVARALHRDGDPTGFVSVRRLLPDARDLERRVRAALESDPGLDALALFVERIDRQPAAVQELCLRWIDEGIRRDGRTFPVRVFAQTDGRRPGEVRNLLRELADRLSSLVIELPGLAERRGDAVALAGFLAADAAARAGRGGSSPIDEAVLHDLAAHASTVEELAAAIARELLASRPGAAPAAAPARGSEPPHAPSRGRDEPGPSSAATSSTDFPPYSLDTLITELAHELKNPMVTIKTFAQHLDHLLTDPELREKFSRLTNEAIDRMDSFLDELLQFSRFGEPTARPFATRELLERCLAGVDPQLQDQVRLNGLGPEGRLRADAEQIGFAFRALLRGFSRELPADAGIVLDSPKPGELVFQAMGAGGTRKLQSLLYPENGAEEETSLHFALAVALIRRNGGTCRILRDADSLEARIQLPAAETR